MKSLTTALFVTCFLLSASLFAQKPKTGCIDAAIEAQANGVKLGLSKKGMIVFQEAFFKMQSMEPVPIVIRLTQGISYELIFVGSENANKIMMEIFDGKDKKIDERIERSMNTIVYTFTPSKTDAYLITLYQKKGLKDLCGYFGVMMKGTPRPAATSDKDLSAPSSKPATVKTPPTPSPVQPAEVKKNKNNAMPDNQRPNPNRTKATREAQQHKK